MLSGYFPTVLLVVLAAGFAIASLAASSLLRPKRPTPAKLSPYESGIVAERVPPDQRFPVKFYLVAMLFILFDIEAIFLYPWAVVYRELKMFAFVEMLERRLEVLEEPSPHPSDDADRPRHVAERPVHGPEGGRVVGRIELRPVAGEAHSFVA